MGELSKSVDVLFSKKVVELGYYGAPPLPPRCGAWQRGGSMTVLNKHGICIEFLPYRKCEGVSTSAEQSPTSVGSTASGLLLQNCST